MLFGVSDWIQDITRRSRIVRKIHIMEIIFQVRKCFGVFIWGFQKVSDGSGRFQKISWSLLETKKGSRNPCGVRQGFVGEQDSPPTSLIRRPTERGVLQGLHLPMAPPSFKQRGGGTNPLAPSIIQISSCLSPPPSLCSGLGEALQNSLLLHHHHAVVLLGFRGEIYYLPCSLERGEEGLLRLRTCDRLRKRCRDTAPEGSSTRS